MEQPQGADGEKKKLTQTNLIGTAGGTLNTAFVDGSPIDVLLFGERKKKDMFNTSMNATNNSDVSTTQLQVMQGLKYLIKTLDITSFDVSTLAPDGTRLYTMESANNSGGLSKLPMEA